MADIEVITEDSPLLEEVQQLWRANRKTLGPYPKGAFAERAQNGEIVAAVENGSVVGYTLYFISGRQSRVRLTHLCVDDTHRGQGIARQLIDALRDRTRSQRGISLHCRRDYAEWSVWPKLGFVAVSEKVGRSKDGHELTYFWLEHSHKTLFSEIDDDERMKVVIDANIFYDLDDPSRNGADETLGVTADWLQPLIQLCINDELFNEIHRNDDSGVRRDRMAKTQDHHHLESNADDFMTANDAVRALLGEPASERDESDQRHLARTIASDATVFVTRDEPVLKVADDIYDQHGLSIVRPAELVAHFEELRNERDYQRARLAGTPLQFCRANSNASVLAEQFQAQSSGERKRELTEQLNMTFAHPDRYECHVVETGNGSAMALHVSERVGDGLFKVPLFRVAKNVLNTRLAPTLIRTLLAGLIQNALRSGVYVVQVTDNRLSPVVTGALQLSGFFKVEDSWLKLSIPEAMPVDQVAQRIGDVVRHAGIETTAVQGVLEAIDAEAFNEDSGAVLEIEHTLWPGKVTGCGVRNYVVAIEPRWATDLFDAGLARSSLFGAETELALNPDSVYYRAARPPMKYGEGRILWYVKHDTNVAGSKCIRACSQLRGLTVGGPKQLFRRFRRFGVYQWKNVLETAGSLDGTLMALEFSDTELLPSPVSWDDTQSILRRYDIRSTFQSPAEISEDAFIELYSTGQTSKS